MKKSRKKGQVYKKMYQTYILVLCVPILLSILFYYYTYREVTSNALLYNSNLNSTIKNTCDEKLQYYQGMTYQLKINEDIKNMVGERSCESSQSYWDSYVVRNQLADVRESMRLNGLNCKDIFLYLEESDKIIYSESVLNYEYYNDQKLCLEEEAAADLKSYLQELKTGSIICRTNVDGQRFFMVLQPAMSNTGKSGSAVIGIVVDVDKIDVENQSIDWEGGMDWMILDSYNQIVRMPDKWESTDVDFSTLNISDGEEVYVNGCEYLVSVAASEVCDWQYILFSPLELIHESAANIRFAYLLCLGASLVVGYKAMKKAMQITYSPLEEMVDIFKEDDGEKEDNEYQYLNKQVTLLMEKNKHNRKNIRKIENDVRGFTIESLIASSKIDMDNPKYSNDIIKKFVKGENVVLIFSIKDSFEEISSEKFMEESSLSRFIVSNVMEECLENLFVQETHIFGDKVLSIIHISEKDENYSEILQALAEEINQFMRDKFQIEVYTLEGGKHRGLEGIHQSYLEACLSESFGFELNEPYIRYEEIKDRTVHKYQYSFEMEQLLINAIHSNNGELAISIIDSALENNFGEDTKTKTGMEKYLLYDIFSTLLKASEDAGIGFDKILEMDHIIDCASKDGAHKYFADIIKSICSEAKENVANSQKQEFCQNIKAYIEDNFTDPDLNISQIALEFQMSPSYLSSVYKRHTGESILEVIKVRRIEYAKQLLEEGLSVAEVSVKAGFRESATFVRMFKKCTGITPGQLRKVDKK